MGYPWDVTLEGLVGLYHDHMFARRMRGSLEQTYSTQNIVYIFVLHSTWETCEKSTDSTMGVEQYCALNAALLAQLGRAFDF